MAINAEDVKVGDRVSVWGTVVENDASRVPFSVHISDGFTDYWCDLPDIDRHKPAPKFAVGDSVRSIIDGPSFALKVVAISGDQFLGLYPTGGHGTFRVALWEKA